ncbi:leucine-rich repeat protein [Metamycoplasma hominis]|uniref:leucine-rich repeat protein n=1 Tax=Metamycoplasma hominis TaxID=2098 RepID=UPI003A5C7BDA
MEAGAFSHINIEYIIIPRSIKEIDESIVDCEKLEEVILNEGLEKLAIPHFQRQTLNLLLFTVQ